MATLSKQVKKPLIGYTGKDFDLKLNETLASYGTSVKVKEPVISATKKPKNYQLISSKQKSK